MNYGFLAGAFSPPTSAHRRLIMTCLDRQLVDHVIVVPSSDAYPKPGLICSKQRLALLQLMLYDIEQATISTIDTDQQIWPTPIETAEKVKHQYLSDSDQLVWIMGSDRFFWNYHHSQLLNTMTPTNIIINVLSHEEIVSISNILHQEYPALFKAHFLISEDQTRSTDIRNNPIFNEFSTILGIDWIYLHS